MQEQHGEEPNPKVCSLPVKGSSSHDGSDSPGERRGPPQLGDSELREALCERCQALKLDDRRFGLSPEFFGDACVSPFPDPDEQSSDDDISQDSDADEALWNRDDDVIFSDNNDGAISSGSNMDKLSSDNSADETSSGYISWDDFYDFPDSFIPLNYSLTDQLPDLPILSESSRKGCNFCALLVRAVRRDSIKRKAETFGTQQLIISGAEYAWGFEVGLCCLGINMEFRNGILAHSVTIPFQVGCPEGECASWLKIRARPLETNPLSGQNADMLRSWLHKCHKSHWKCNHKSTISKLPTRLLDVGGRNFDKDPRLIISAADPTLSVALDTPYAALSHCWGKESLPLKTEASSISHRLKSIPMDSMPSTYRDAILLTRSLRIRYLWIDSLCIIQDDASDWERESTTMSEVYRNAHVTLCALVNSCDEGFLPQARQSIEIPFKSSVKPQVHGSYSLHEIWPRFADNDWDTHSLITWLHSYDESEWKHRGWTFQEERFSSRRLICSLQKFVYVCDSKYRAEDGVMPGRSVNKSMFHELEQSVRRGGKQNLYTVWYNSVHQYSHRSLTFAQDCFPAVSALAAMIADRTGDRYIAGLWEADLHRGLLWRSFLSGDPNSILGLSNFIQELTRPGLFIAPSWSWASLQTVKGWITYEQTNPELTICEAHAQIDGLNPFGRIKDAHLLVSGKLHHAQRFTLSPLYETRYRVKFSGSFIAEWFLDCVSTDEEVFDEGVGEGCKWGADSGLFMLLVSSSLGYEEMDELAVALYEEWSRAGPRLCKQLFGLVLHYTATDNAYRRIGVFKTIEWESGGSKVFESVPETRIKLV
ncbi:het domain-containing protein [Diplodia corticola]|uniref:Het domain-containing protein n=1 Tax=Diplodia corticola TaxID=236234 RepID=A0A1J9QL90_9PEZI|nr:het domain-containing protein [Diplodia corticola]OJD28826.1 het domain-containing protein [Diplodia corticola]